MLNLKKYAISVCPPYGFRIISVWEEYAGSMREVSGMYGNYIAAAYLKYAC